MTVLTLTLAVFQLWLTHRIYRNHVGAAPKSGRNNRMEKATYEP